MQGYLKNRGLKNINGFDRHAMIGTFGMGRIRLPLQLELSKIDTHDTLVVTHLDIADTCH